MLVAGTSLGNTEIAAFAEKLRDADMYESADRIEREYREGSTLFHIEPAEREAFVDALDGGCPDELRQLWAALKEPLP